MSTYERVHDVPAAVRQDLADWLLALADNKRVLGLRYAEWCTGAPELEADVAISAMAQYELGHTRLLRGVLSELDEDPRDEARENDPSTWRSLAALDRPTAGWPEIVILNGLVDNLLTANMAAATEGGLRPLAQRLRKAVSEEEYHSLHAAAWLARLREGPVEMVARVDEAIATVWPQCLAWFGPAGDDNALDRLADAGVIGCGANELRARYLGEVAPLIEGSPPAGVIRAGEDWRVEIDLDWEGWNPAARRHGTPDFDADSFAMITGAHARAMGVED